MKTEPPADIEDTFRPVRKLDTRKTKSMTSVRPNAPPTANV